FARSEFFARRLDLWAVCELFGGAGKRLNDTRIQLGKQRQHLASDAYAGKTSVLIHRVGEEADVIFLAVRGRFLASRNMQKRPHELSLAFSERPCCWHSGKAVLAASANKIKQKGLGLVADGMAGQHGKCAVFFGSFCEESVAGVAGIFLEVAAFCDRR